MSVAWGGELVGFFVRKLAGWLEQQARTESSAAAVQRLFVRDDTGQQRKLIFDLAVYTKNRLFRLLHSTKFGKSVFLERAPSCVYPVSGGERGLFAASLVCYHPDRPPPPSTAVGAPPPLRVLMCDAQDVPPLSVPFRTGHTPRTGQVVSRPGTSASPFPLLDDFVRLLITGADAGEAATAGQGPLVRPPPSSTASVSGYVKSWLYFADTRTLAYNIGGGYRYCNNIGRHHKSNGVYLVADLVRGELVQKCYDPECAGYRSAPTPIPSVYLSDATAAATATSGPESAMDSREADRATGDDDGAIGDAETDAWLARNAAVLADLEAAGEWALCGDDEDATGVVEDATTSAPSTGTTG